MLFVLPGMGADHRMYPAPWPSLSDSVFVDWPKFRGEESLTDLAKRLIDEHHIESSAWLAGSSLGGMVACEIATMVSARGLILIGSARSPDEIRPLLKTLSPLIELAPLSFIQRLAGKAPSELLEMFSASDPDFVRAMCRAIFRWEGLRDFSGKVLRVHGRKDQVIPLPSKVDLMLDGGHLIALSHARECVEFIRADRILSAS